LICFTQFWHRVGPRRLTIRGSWLLMPCGSVLRVIKTKISVSRGFATSCEQEASRRKSRRVSRAFHNLSIPLADGRDEFVGPQFLFRKKSHVIDSV